MECLTWCTWNIIFNTYPYLQFIVKIYKSFLWVPANQIKIYLAIKAMHHTKICCPCIPRDYCFANLNSSQYFYIFQTAEHLPIVAPSTVITYYDDQDQSVFAHPSHKWLTLYHQWANKNTTFWYNPGGIRPESTL